MSIRWKSLLALAAVIVGVNLLLYFSARLIILDSYLELEQVKALQDMQRVRSVLQDDLSHLGLMTHNIAHSEQAYKFLTGEEEGAFLDRFAAPNHLHVDTHLIAFVDRKGRLHHGHYMEPGEREDGVLPANIERRLAEMPFLWRHTSHAERFEGVLLFPGGAMLVSSSPIAVPDHPTEVVGIDMQVVGRGEAIKKSAFFLAGQEFVSLHAMRDIMGHQPEVREVVLQHGAHALHILQSIVLLKLEIAVENDQAGIEVEKQVDPHNDGGQGK